MLKVSRRTWDGPPKRVRVSYEMCIRDSFGDERDIVVIFEIPLAGENLDKVGISALVLEIDGEMCIRDRYDTIVAVQV